MEVINVSDQEFEAKILGSDKVVVLDFWAEWCGPCKALAPTLEQVAANMNDKAIIAKMNVDDNQSTPSKYGVRGIPMLALFKNGEMASSKVGVQSEKDITDWINEYI